MNFLKNLKIINKLLVIIIVVLIFLLGIGLFFFFELRNISHQFNKSIPAAINEVKKTSELNSVAQFIRYYDEVLTQSARNYAFTGDEKWLNRYNNNIPELDEKIKYAIVNGDESDKKLFEEIDVSNQALIKMEVASQNAVKNGDEAQAITILESTDYANQKAIYAGALEKFVESRGAKYDEAIQASTTALNQTTAQTEKLIMTSEIIGLILLLIAIAMTIFFSHSIAEAIVRPIAKLKAVTSTVSQGNLDAKIEIDAKDEIGDLARNFNSMISAIKESRSNIDLKVEEQTRVIREAQVKDEAYLESIGDGLIVVDKNEKIILVNPQAEIMLGFTKDELTNKKFSDVIQLVDKDGKLLPESKRPIKEVLASGKKNTFTDYYYVRKDKTKFPIALTTAPVVLDKKTIGAIDVFRDITLEKQIDQAKTEFVSLASHQLRTPLSTINWYAEMLLAGDAGKITEEQKKFVNQIYGGSQRMVELVNALLNVSRIELGTFVIEPEPIDFSKLVDSIIEELRPDIEKKEIIMTKEYEKLPFINVDPKLIRIVIQNLITNAIKYTPDKGKVKVSLKKEGPDILIEVKDNGYGIPRSQQKMIFTKLFRADNVKEKDTEGTGLGLYIVKSIVDQSGGKIWFDSIENKGTIFFVKIPLSGMKKKEGSKGLSESKY